MASSKGKKFTADEEARLIEAVEQRPLLWDPTTEVYKRADLKPQVWSEVAAIVGANYTGNDVLARFKCLKDTFMKNWRKVLDTKSSGAGTDDVYKPRWNLFEKLKFLIKTNAQAPSSSNIPTQVAGNACVEGYYYDENLQTCMLLPVDENSCIVSDSSELASPSPMSSLVLSGPSSPDVFVPPRPASAPSTTVTGKRVAEPQSPDGLFTKKGCTKMTGSALMVEAVKVMKDISMQQLPSVEASPSDGAALFSSFVASRLRSMDSDVRRQCENEIMAVLMRYQ